MSYGTTVLAALDALVAALAGLRNDSTLVVKGPVVGNTPARAAVIVGGDGEGAPAVQVQVGQFDRNRFRQTETYSINCAVLVTSGSTNLDLLISDAMGLLDAVGAALTADKTLAGAVTDCRITSWTLDLAQPSTGGLVRVPFVVDVTALTTP